MASYMITDDDLWKVTSYLAYALVAWTVASMVGILSLHYFYALKHVAVPIYLVFVGYVLYIMFIVIPRLKKTRPKELTAEEKTQLAAKETDLYDQLSKLAKVKIEYLKGEIDRVKLDFQLSALTGGAPSEHQIPKEIMQLDQQLEKLANYDVIQKRLEEHRQKFPSQSEFVDALLDKYREEFLRKKD